MKVLHKCIEKNWTQQNLYFMKIWNIFCWSVALFPIVISLQALWIEKLIVNCRGWYKMPNHLFLLFLAQAWNHFFIHVLAHLLFLLFSWSCQKLILKRYCIYPMDLSSNFYFSRCSMLFLIQVISFPHLHIDSSPSIFNFSLIIKLQLQKSSKTI